MVLIFDVGEAETSCPPFFFLLPFQVSGIIAHLRRQAALI